MREIQDKAECPRCAESRALPGTAKVSPPVAAHVKKVMGEYQGAQPVVILDLNMSFNSMVWFMVKWVLASIPAFIILFVIFAILFFMFPVLAPQFLGD
ncbi:hypothetical protein ACUTAF_08210 [Pseudomonas sp. SP16.1]|uniref:hypothetical protein n=1 Tax=Pseudomonas sp. SP16.1 TaxID=3458854 RepID=UPI004045D5D5